MCMIPMNMLICNMEVKCGIHSAEAWSIKGVIGQLALQIKCVISVWLHGRKLITWEYRPVNYVNKFQSTVLCNNDRLSFSHNIDKKLFLPFQARYMMSCVSSKFDLCLTFVTTLVYWTSHRFVPCFLTTDCIKWYILQFHGHFFQATQNRCSIDHTLWQVLFSAYMVVRLYATLLYLNQMRRVSMYYTKLEFDL